MIQTMIKNWWLLALCGVLEAILSGEYLIMLDPDGSPTLRTHAVKSTIVLLGRLALAAGVCTITAGVWRSTKSICWLLVLHGLALGALGLIFNGVFGFRISLSTIALLLVVMAMSLGVLELATARNLRGGWDKWILGLAGVGSVGFALLFVALGAGWIRLGPGSHWDIFWIGSYFGFSAVCMVGMALRLRGLEWGAFGTLGNPEHAH